LDYYGGEADLHDRVIRVLHSLSFVDDPTRMLRAARLESRMGFKLDPRSEELIADGLPLLKRVSGDRIRHELEQVFREAEPERTLYRLEELGILAHIHPDLRCDRWLQTRYRMMREGLQLESSWTEILGLGLGPKPQDDAWNMDVWNLEPDDSGYLHLALLVYRLDSEALNELLTRLKVRRDHAEDIRLLPSLKEVLPQVGKARQPSAVYRSLQPYPSRVLAVAWLATDRKRIQRRLLSYQTEWRWVEAEITGNDLKARGLKPGPVYGRILGALRDARLDGKVSTREEEDALLERLLVDERERE
jgi:tRNA nucleotidyltransferase (CCA-adding enzyme)